MDTGLGDAVAAYIWDDRSAIPGRHPERVADPALRARVEAVIQRLDTIVPDSSASDLAGWADRQAAAVADECGGLTPEAVRALGDLLSWNWR